MDRPPEELQRLTLGEVLRESVSIPRASPRTFAPITLVLVFPLSFAVLAHNLFTHPIIHRLQTTSTTTISPPSQLDLGAEAGHAWALLFFYQFLYLLFLFTFSLLATAAVVFTVASIYAAKPVSFLSTLNAIPPVFSRLFRTFLWVSLLMFLYNSAFLLAIIVVIILSGGAASSPGPVALLLLALIFLLFLSVHVYITALWHLASVITVLEPVCGLAAMKKSRELLQGRTRMALVLVLGYLGTCGLIGGLFGAVVVRAGEEDGVQVSPIVRVLVGGALVAVLVVLNLVGLLVQSVFYYVCKSYHHQSIDKSALYEHLGGYLGEYVPLKSSIQMESFEL
ncbi:hypothetical protein Taro_038330 [Colocasia esculenta]|uniref:Uncharacterized protein n=1 Tax=Colocasia esculenta TaxID=4460 RepID=A0A843WLW2_COLES|nr:hypothetical protein [Colocasia esculenta]